MTAMPGTLPDLLDQLAAALERNAAQSVDQGRDQAVALVRGRLLQTIGTLHLYEFFLPPEVRISADLAASLLLGEETEPTEGLVLFQEGERLVLQVFDAIGEVVPHATLVPDSSGLALTISRRLAEMSKAGTSYTLGPAERLLPIIEAGQSGDRATLAAVTPTSVLTPLWQEDEAARRQKVATLVVELIRANKRILLVTPDHQSADLITLVVARVMKAAGLTFKSWLSRYEVATSKETGGIPLPDLGFEAQMHQFYAKSRSDKAALRKKYDRFRELTPILAYKAQKQKDLDEVRLLEWRLVTQLSDYQAKIKDIDATLAQYEQLPIWKRLSMQAMGKNVESLREYKVIYERYSAGLRKEVDIAKQRIEELIPEATVPKELKPEFAELKEDVIHLGGTKKIRELLAAEENTNRQAFVQNRRVIITTAARVAADPLFQKVRFDVLIAEEAPRIPSPFLLAAAGLVRERIVLSGDLREVVPHGAWSLEDGFSRIV
ncbi:MAG TPA: hypothetical protein PKI24_10570 [Nitrospira sp.]|nr:hypothetical protein [Nitrospira sp.]HMU31287.1 hypothetical protein [Nitrospira sp.]HMV56232.1 hypothetical protein [Nitrospira sp.]HNK79141.1 hypothetical protein [Nitrospira sp.]HNM60817.1 hypothetical protein [Nitrospira sp.]